MDLQVKEIMKIMETISYGFKDKSGKNILDENIEKWNRDFASFYYLQTPDELLKTKCGVCWDQVELERKLFLDYKIKIKTYFIYIDENNKLPSHTFLVYKNNDKYYWFEHSWYSYKGIHEYNTLNDLLLDVEERFKKDNKNIKGTLYIYEYQKPKEHLSCDEFYDYIKKENLVIKEKL